MESMISLFSIYHCLELLGDIVDRAYIVAVVDLWAVEEVDVTAFQST
jgi:hypothetical protein